MLKLLAILQIFSIILANTGINLYFHFCHTTDEIIVSITKEDAICKDHVCCEYNYENKNDFAHCTSNCCNKENNELNSLTIKDLECCQNAEKYIVLNENSIQIQKISSLTVCFTPKIDYNKPFYIHFNIPKIHSTTYFNPTYYLHQKILLPTIYFSSDLT